MRRRTSVRAQRACSASARLALRIHAPTPTPRPQHHLLHQQSPVVQSTLTRGTSTPTPTPTPQKSAASHSDGAVITAKVAARATQASSKLTPPALALASSSASVAPLRPPPTLPHWGTALAPSARAIATCCGGRRPWCLDCECLGSGSRRWLEDGTDSFLAPFLLCDGSSARWNAWSSPSLARMLALTRGGRKIELQQSNRRHWKDVYP
jgi:hypothetical protein